MFYYLVYIAIYYSEYREWDTFDSCFFFSTRAHTSHLMSDGAIPVLQVFYVSWLQATDFCSVCRIQYVGVMRSRSDWCCIFSDGITLSKRCGSDRACTCAPLRIYQIPQKIVACGHLHLCIVYMLFVAQCAIQSGT